MSDGMQGLDLVAIARRLALVLVPMILSLTVHECAHAGSAYLLGDKTAKEAGRLTLNPQAHIDPWGTLFIPAMSVFMGFAPFLGWARPTPMNPVHFREGIPRRTGTVLVSIAGPLSNVVLAFVSISILAALAKVHFPLYSVNFEDGEAVSARPGPIYALLLTMFELNLGLAFFNLLPIPPLDGYRLLPPFLERYVRPLERYGFGLLMIIVLLLPSSLVGIVFRPILHLIGWVEVQFGLA